MCRSNDIDVATAAKFRVEQKQREEAKLRKDENAVWANTVRILGIICACDDKLDDINFWEILILNS